MKKFTSIGRKIICGVLASTMLLGAVSCHKMSNDAVCLSKGIKPTSGISGSNLDDSFINGTANFSLELFKRNVKDGENSVISPFSVMMALSMTANGANGETLAQMEKALGGNDIQSLNKYIYTYVNSLPNTEKAKLVSANSIWMKNSDDFNVNQDFLQANANYYSAEAYKAPFDGTTLDDMNNWVYKNTDKQIEKIINDINPYAVMYLINAITFDAEWATVYEDYQVTKQDFYGTDGTNRVEMMHSSEHTYLEDDKAIGFMKPYADGYSYAVIMPNEGVSLQEYVSELSGESFVNMLTKGRNADYCEVIATMPKFKSEYSVSMNDALNDMGMTDAFVFQQADFSGINGKRDLYIGNVAHKAVIEVNERGTKAGAATAVELLCGSALPEEEPKVVTVDHPFIYAIVDNQTNLPIFIGAVSNL